MNHIPKRLRAELADDPYYRRCARESGECAGRITWEHVFIYAGRQINKRWNIIPLCWHHHLGAGLIKEINEWIAINRASVFDLEQFGRHLWLQHKGFLNGKYGTYVPPARQYLTINY